MDAITNPRIPIADALTELVSSCCGAKPFMQRCSECRETCDWVPVEPPMFSPDIAIGRLASNPAVWIAVGYAALFVFGVAFAVNIIFPADVIWANAAKFWQGVFSV